MNESTVTGRLRMDEHLQAVLEFMQRNIPAAKLIAVAGGIAKIAPLLWETYKQEELSLITFSEAPISSSLNGVNN